MRPVIGSYCFKKSKIYMLKKCGWLDAEKMILCSAMKFIHNVIKSKTPKSIFDMFKINRRPNVDIVTLYRPKTQKTLKFFTFMVGLGDIC